MDKQKLVVLSGAGVSAESGLKTFRDSNGLWAGHNIEDVATPRAWKKNPQLVLEFYNYRRNEVRCAQPNSAHIGIKELEEWFDVTIITQNIDDLHERAGSKNVLHLHGEIFKMRSELNEHLIYEIKNDISIGDLAEDGHQLRPYIVWFEEPVPLIEKAIQIATTADIFVVIGTSLVVYPAAGLVQYIPPYSRKFVIDTSIPEHLFTKSFISIEQPASQGIIALKEALLASI